MPEGGKIEDVYFLSLVFLSCSFFALCFESFYRELECVVATGFIFKSLRRGKGENSVAIEQLFFLSNKYRER